MQAHVHDTVGFGPDNQNSDLPPSQILLVFQLPVVLHYYKCNGENMESAITVKGQATIPKEIREHLGLKPGDRLKFFYHPDGSVVLLPKVSARTLRGMVRSRRRRPVTIDEMTKAAAQGASGSAPRAKRQ